MSAANELSALISKTVEEQTLSLDAVRAVGVIRDRAIALEAQLAKSTENNDKAQSALMERDRALAEWKARGALLLARELAVAEREKKITELEQAKAVAVGQFTVLDGVFRTIFANRIVRENTVTTTPIPTQMQGGGSYVTNYDTRNTIDRTEG